MTWKEIKAPRSSCNGPQGAYLGNLEYQAQSNKSANCVEKNSRFKCVDDLTTLEKINLLLIGMVSYNIRNQIPNDIISNNMGKVF